MNPALRLAADAFVTQTLAGLDAYPAYYAHMGVLNLRGPAPVDLRPPALISPEELRARLRAGEWVVDLRHRTAYAEAHLAGTISLGLDGPMATWLGWLIGRGAPLTLVGRTPEEVAQARRELVRIGVDHVSAAAAGTPRALAADPAQVRSLPTATFAGLAAALAGDVPAGLPAPRVILDVRLGNEWRASHLDGAVHVPLPELAARAGDIPAGGRLGALRQRLPGHRGGLAAGQERAGGRGGGRRVRRRRVVRPGHGLLTLVTRILLSLIHE
ncbi:hypothetical protein GCM10020220_061060 [Nonomuraea rubra]